MTTTVFIDRDPATLGPDATQADLDAYAQNLAAHLGERFGIHIDIERVLGGNRAGSKCPQNDAIDAYVRELEAGSGWIELLPSDDIDSERTQLADHLHEQAKERRS
jgi:hypothetical protein